MQSDRARLFARLEALGIASTTVEHAPMFTVAQSEALHVTLPGAHTKNLFLIDKNDHRVLVVAQQDTKVDLKGLAAKLGHGRYSFGKPELLRSVLGIEPGSVTPFALMNDTSCSVTVVVDQRLMDHAEVNCHPLVNAATTRIASQDLLRFIEACGHRPAVLPLA
jgi:Ala-tRNA(Pro) deacylase